MTVAGGTATVGGISGTGTVNISEGGSLSVNGPVATGQRLAFEDPTGILSIGDSISFAGTIAGDLIPENWTV